MAHNDEAGSKSELEARWRAIPAGELLTASWGELAAIHHRASGKTHFINRSTLVLLTDVLSAAKTADTAARHLAQGMGVEPTREFVTEVAGMIVRLDELGLIRRGPFPAG